ncbi:MAG: antitoxin Xre-like helix-turn-helix domain-containing protein [Bacteroidota bacterium]
MKKKKRVQIRPQEDKQGLRNTGERVPTVVVALLGSVAASTPRLHRLVLEGLPFAPLERLQKALGLTGPQVASLLQIPPRTLARRKTEGRLHPAESDRLLRTSMLYGKAVELFGGDRDATRRWFLSPMISLAGNTPFEYAKSEPGAREVERVIGRLERGVTL